LRRFDHFFYLFSSPSSFFSGCGSLVLDFSFVVQVGDASLIPFSSGLLLIFSLIPFLLFRNFVAKV
jgi:hypothetical protein